MLMSLGTIGPFSTDAYLPNLLQVQQEFDVTTSSVALTLQSNLVCSALACVGLGILADRWGRRRVVAGALAVYVLGCAAAGLSTGLGTLVAARMLMGIGQSSQVLAQVIARDLVDDAQQRLRVMGVLGSVAPLVVMAAPAAGGAIGSAVGWRGLFWAQLVWGGLTLLGSGTLPGSEGPGREADSSGEENPDACSPVASPAPQRSGSASAPAPPPAAPSSPPQPPPLAGVACRLLGSRLFVGALGLYGLLFVAISAMITLLPFMLEQYYHLSSAEAGALMAVVPLFLITGSLLTAQLSKCLGPFALLRMVNIAFLFVSALFGALALLFQELSQIGIPLQAWWPVLVPCFLMSVANGIMLPVTETLYLHGDKDIAGAAAGAAGFVMALMMAVGSAVASSAWDGTPRSFYATLAAATLAIQLWFWLSLGISPPADAPGLEAEVPASLPSGCGSASRAAADAAESDADTEAGEGSPPGDSAASETSSSSGGEAGGGGDVEVGASPGDAHPEGSEVGVGPSCAAAVLPPAAAVEQEGEAAEADECPV